MAVVDSAAAGERAAGRGATHVLLRMPGASAHEQYLELVELVAGGSIPVLVSDRIDLALAAGATGVNLPETGLGVGDARALLGPERLVGRSVHSVEGARLAGADGADFVLFGPVFPTPTHPGHPGLGLAALDGAVRAAGTSVLAIGGVTAERAAQCMELGAAGFAAIRMFNIGAGT